MQQVVGFLRPSIYLCNTMWPSIRGRVNALLSSCTRQGSTLRLLNHLPTGQVPLHFDLPECKIYLPDVVFVTPNQGGPTFPFFLKIFLLAPSGRWLPSFTCPTSIFTNYLPRASGQCLMLSPARLISTTDSYIEG